MTTATASPAHSDVAAGRGARRRGASHEDQELKEYRDLMLPPDRWEEGFGVKAMIGGLFVGLIMTPASMYMNLVAGLSMGDAARWVTVILFIEVARRSFTVLGRPEIYILYYMAGVSLVSGSGPLIWNQFLAQSESFRGFGISLPPWVAPMDPDVLGRRTFFHPAWVLPIGLTVLGSVIGRLDHFGLGYVMYRLTSDVERLPFPLAPVSAQGVTALADASNDRETWRWRVFSFGAMLGMVFAAVYVALPAISGAFLPQPISLFPLPFKDLTGNTETFLPATAVMLSLDLGLLLVGMVLPFWAMVGGFVGLVATMIANPLLYKTGVLRSWRPGVGAVTTLNANYLDFYLSFGLGLTAAIAVIGFWHVGAGLFRRKRALDENAVATMNWSALFRPPAGRGDISIWLAIGIYVLTTTANILIAWYMLDWAHSHGMGSAVSKTLIGILIFYGFIYTPILSYVSARMQGLIGQGVNVPFVREATFILTGYQGAAIWFTPFPAHNYGYQTQFFRETELTGTKLTSVFKAELFVLPVTIIATVVFSQFIWGIAPIPSAAFPNAEKFWEVEAFRQGVFISSTLPGGEYGPFFQAIKPTIIAAGLGLALALYAGMNFFGLPIMMVYGVIRGLDQSTPVAILPMFIGALLGRYHFKKKFGSNWQQYIVVFLAGYSCGVGLVMMLSLGLVFMSKSVFQATY